MIDVRVLNRIASRSSFSATVTVARKIGLSAVGHVSSSELTDLIDGVYQIFGEGFDPDRRYVVLVGYEHMDDGRFPFTYRSPNHTETIRVFDVQRIRANAGIDEPFGTWRVARAPYIEATAIAYPLSPANGEYPFNRNLSPYVEVTLINPRNGLLSPSLTSVERWTVAVGCTMYDWEYAIQNIADLRHSDIIAIEREFFGGRPVGWRAVFDDPIDCAVPDGSDRLARLIRGDVVDDYPPTPDDVMRIVGITGRIPRIVLDLLQEE